MIKIAHRGLWSAGRPENSVRAFEAAAAQGFGIELDVHLSKDGVPMVFHDASLTRMTEQSGFVFRTNAAALQDYPLVGGTPQDTIPTLATVLGRLPKALPILVEIKPPHSDSPWREPETAAAIMDVISRAGLPNVCAMSFSSDITTHLRAGRPSVPVGYLADMGHLEPVRTAVDTQARFAAVWRDDVQAAREILGRNGPALFTWTIQSRAQQEVVRPFVGGVIFEGF